MALFLTKDVSYKKKLPSFWLAVILPQSHYIIALVNLVIGQFKIFSVLISEPVLVFANCSRFCDTRGNLGKVKEKLTRSTLTRSNNYKKWKESLETRAVFSWILILTWNFGGDRSGSASTFFKIASTSVSEAVEKIPRNKKGYRRCSFMCFTSYSHSIQRTTMYSRSIQK